MCATKKVRELSAAHNTIAGEFHGQQGTPLPVDDFRAAG
jgi:hypothetical protein